MPSMHIPEGVFRAYVEQYGYDGAKDQIKQTLRENAPNDE